LPIRRRGRSQAAAALRPPHLAGGFQELAAKAAGSAPAAARAGRRRARRRPGARRAEDLHGGETGVVAPVIVTQALPPFPDSHHSAQRKLEIVIDENGAVESAVMRSRSPRPTTRWC